MVTVGVGRDEADGLTGSAGGGTSTVCGTLAALRAGGGAEGDDGADGLAALPAGKAL
ncbi:MAG: hypothetical protein LBH53_02260 [Puniceicoccales bacterium]|nr:hypothetical protein [Puniceicoccales bacterium]